MSEEMLIRYCAPTLAGMKTGNLFACPYQRKEEIRQDIRKMNRLLREKGIRILPMKYFGGKALIYLYRPGYLKRDFQDAARADLLWRYGYPADAPECCLARLAHRLQENDEFPHEIGLFLGYPPEDVQGFIEHGAKHCKCAGFWKVYGDVKKAEKTFLQYQECIDVYGKKWEEGVGIESLAKIDSF